MKLAAGLITLAIAVTQVAAVVPVWGQCGGIGYTGETRECWIPLSMVLG